jgi:hypothetical protein
MRREGKPTHGRSTKSKGEDLSDSLPPPIENAKGSFLIKGIFDLFDFAVAKQLKERKGGEEQTDRASMRKRRKGEEEEEEEE